MIPTKAGKAMMTRSKWPYAGTLTGLPPKEGVIYYEWQPPRGLPERIFTMSKENISNECRERAVWCAESRGVNLDEFVKKCMDMGIEEHRVYELISSYYGSFDEVWRVVATYGAEALNKGYTVSICRDPFIRCVYRFEPAKLFYNNTEAATQAEKDGIKLIPVSELPEDSFLIFDLDKRLVDTPENREALRRFFAKHSLQKRKERKFRWVVGICASDGDEVNIYRVDGTVHQMREHLFKGVCAHHYDGDWQFGTESPEEVVIKERDENWIPEKMCAYACNSDYHVDFTAARISALEMYDIEGEEGVAV